MFTLSLLCLFAFLAGFIDSIVGGGGLILIPAILLLHPELPLATTLGTNKAVALFGILTATFQYARTVGIPWKIMSPAAVTGFIFSWLGAYVVTLLSEVNLRPFILIILFLVAIYTFIKKDFGKFHAPTRSIKTQIWIGILAAAGIGFYDGFLGPGTGSFLTFALIGLMSFSFLTAAASARFINLSTNLAAAILFAFKGNILYSLFLPLALCNVLGAFLGSRVVVLKGSEFVRILFLVVVVGFMARLSYDTFFK